MGVFVPASPRWGSSGVCVCSAGLCSPFMFLISPRLWVPCGKLTVAVIAVRAEAERSICLLPGVPYAIVPAQLEEMP